MSDTVSDKHKTTPTWLRATLFLGLPLCVAADLKPLEARLCTITILNSCFQWPNTHSFFLPALPSQPLTPLLILQEAASFFFLAPCQLSQNTVSGIKRLCLEVINFSSSTWCFNGLSLSSLQEYLSWLKSPPYRMDVNHLLSPIPLAIPLLVSALHPYSSMILNLGFVAGFCSCAILFVLPFLMMIQ